MTDAMTALPVGMLIRVSVTAGDRRVDLGIPGNVPVAEVVPGLARALGLLDAMSAHGGYRLIRPDGAPIDSARSLLAEGVPDGTVLTLESGALRDEERIYDDVVEAVADAVESGYAPWTPKDSALSAVWASIALLAAGAVLLLGADRASLLPPVIAGVAAVLVLVSGAVVTRTGAEPAAGRLLVLIAPALGGLAGFIAGAQAPSWGWPTAWAGAGLLLTGLASLPALVDQREFAAASLAGGFTLAVSGTVIELADIEPGVVLAVVVALAATASIGVPWLALASTPLRVVTPRSDAEIFADPPEVQAQRVRSQLAAGHRVQVSLRVAIGVLAVAAAPAVVATGVPGTVLLMLAFTGMLLATRQTYSRTDVLLTVTLSVVGLGATVLLAAALHPQWRPLLVGLCGAAAAVVVTVSLIAPRQRLTFARVGDFLEVLCLAVLLPLGVAAAGLV
ncbi:type VII secretion integral membrane protein EccD [Cellulomonas sp. NPDC089187]|uniref:type VII secretion integral membrane protein EccD n=1 Tax=Cellulomonas sp. NPDC089187 TaxID=3154970 RepID=UPI00342A1810